MSEKRTGRVSMIAVGLVLGTSFGAALGTVFGNIAIGVGLGTAFGIIIGSVLDARAKKRAGGE